MISDGLSSSMSKPCAATASSLRGGGRRLMLVIVADTGNQFAWAFSFNLFGCNGCNAFSVD